MLEAKLKKCLFCAEEIQDEAIKCKHCGEMQQRCASTPGTQVVVPANDSKAAVNPLAASLSFFGLWALYYGGSKWFGAHETQQSMAAGGAGDFSRPMMEQMMSSGLTYAGCGLALLIVAGVIQAGQGSGVGEAHAIESPPVNLSSQARAIPAVGLALIAGLALYCVSLIGGMTNGQAVFLGLTGALAGAAAGWAAAPALAKAEQKNPSGFRVK